MEWCSEVLRATEASLPIGKNSEKGRYFSGPRPASSLFVMAIKELDEAALTLPMQTSWLSIVLPCLSSLQLKSAGGGQFSEEKRGLCSIHLKFLQAKRQGSSSRFLFYRKGILVPSHSKLLREFFESDIFQTVWVL